MDVEQEKAAAFVGHLWNNPSLAGLSPLQKEEQLHQFLDTNEEALKPTLTSGTFFPNFPWSMVRDLLNQALSDLANAALAPLYEAILMKKMDFGFVENLTPKPASPERVKSQLSQFLTSLTEKTDSRRELTGPMMALGTGIVDRYMEQIFRRQRYIKFELRKVQRLKIPSDDIADLVKAAMLVRPAVQYFLSAEKKLLFIPPTFAAKVVEEARGVLDSTPEEVVRSGVNSSLSYQENPQMETTARLAAVFSHRCRNLKPGMKVDRGAESSDKSWFSVARKNYKFYGFDLDMLVELHSIATENGW